MQKPSFGSYGNYSSSNYGAHCQYFTDPNGNTFYYSYDTLVAFETPQHGLTVLKNYWGPTTGKHLNWIDDGRKNQRVDRDTFNRLYAERIEGQPGNQQDEASCRLSPVIEADAPDAFV